MPDLEPIDPRSIDWDSERHSTGEVAPTVLQWFKSRQARPWVIGISVALAGLVVGLVLVLGGPSRADRLASLRLKQLHFEREIGPARRAALESAQKADHGYFEQPALKAYAEARSDDLPIGEIDHLPANFDKYYRAHEKRDFDGMQAAVVGGRSYLLMRYQDYAAYVENLLNLWQMEGALRRTESDIAALGEKP